MLKNYSSEEGIEKEIEARVHAISHIIETPEERRLQLKKVEWLRDHLMNIHSKKHIRMVAEEPVVPIKTPEQEARENKELLKLIDSVSGQDELSRQTDLDYSRRIIMEESKKNLEGIFPPFK